MIWIGGLGFEPLVLDGKWETPSLTTKPPIQITNWREADVGFPHQKREKRNKKNKTRNIIRRWGVLLKLAKRQRWQTPPQNHGRDWETGQRFTWSGCVCIPFNPLIPVEPKSDSRIFLWARTLEANPQGFVMKGRFGWFLFSAVPLVIEEAKTRNEGTRHLSA